MGDEKAGRQLTFGELGIGSGNGEQFSSVDEILGEKIEIKGVELMEGRTGQLLALTIVGREKRVRTGGKVLIEKGSHIKKAIDSGNTVITKIVKVPNKNNPYKHFEFVDV